MERSLQFKDHIHLSESVFEVVVGLSSSTGMSYVMIISCIQAENRKHLATTTQVTVTATDMM